MRLTTVILIATFMQVSATSFGQRITLNARNSTLEKVLKEIRHQSGYDFLFSENLIKSSRTISFSVRDATIEETLAKCFSDLPITYKIDNRTVLLKAKEPSLLDKIAAAFIDDVEISGVVVNKKTNEPLTGATMKVMNKRIGTGTNSKGEFFLPKLDEHSVIIFSYIGFDSAQVKLDALLGLGEGSNAFSKNVTITKVKNGYFLKIELEPSVSYLDEMIVQGYGVTDRRMATGNIAKVTAAEIEKQPVMNPLMALQGRVPGMVVTPTTGYASGTVKVEIRGRSAINSNFTSDPLYIIDGVPLTYLEIGGISNYQTGSTGVNQSGSFAGGAGQSPFFNLNPADIESIEVLKDADATAIYGSRGANGVILITTKKGKTGATTITADVFQGLSKVASHWDMLNTEQYVAMRKEAFKNDGIVPTALNAPDLVVWDTTRYTDWQKELWGNRGQLTSVSTAIAGGNENTQFRISSNYTRQTEILTATGANRKVSLAFNLTNFSANRKLKTNLSANYSFTDVNNVNTSSAVTLAPNAPPIYNSDGGLNYQEWNEAGLPDSYPFASLKGIANSQTHLLTANLNLAYQLFEGLEVSSNFGYNNSRNHIGGGTTIEAQNPIYNPTGMATVLNSDNQNWIVEPQFSYKANIGKGRLTALIGATLQATVAGSSTIIGYGYTDDDLLGSLSLAPFTQVTDKSGQYKYAALFSRLNYTWDDKYVLNISGRRDGSSRFGKGKQYGNFGAIGLAWIASQETWIKNVLPSYISFIKLRGSYGITGSDGVGDYQYLTQWSSSVNYTPVLSYGGVKPLVSLHGVNPNYQWQENKKLEGGLSISFLNDRINFETAYYQNRCNNQLTDYPTPVFTGFPTVTANWPANIQNSGWEFSLSAKLINQKNFRWSASLNGSFNKNVLIDYPDIEHSPYATQYYIGRPLNAVYLHHYTGINPLTGEYAYEDHNGDGVLTMNFSGMPGEGNDDRYITVNLDPKFLGGIGNEFQYKNWNLSVFFQYKNQMGYNSNYAGQSAGVMANTSVDIYNNRWIQPGQQVKYARLTTAPANSDRLVSGSDLYYTDASYLRLNNVSLTYTLPEKLLKNKSLSIYMHAQNLWILTNYEGLDPDTQNFGSMPTAKVFTAGLSLKL